MRRHLPYLLRALCSFIIGGLLLSNPEKMTTILIMVIGGLFILSGLVPTITYWLPQSKEQQEKQTPTLRPMFPILGLGCMLFGAILVFRPEAFITALMYVLGGLMVLAGVHQTLSLFAYRQVAPPRMWYYIFPLLLVAVGIFILCRPLESASVPFIILGIGCIFYALMDLIYGIRLARAERKKQGEYVEFEEVKDEEHS